MPIDKRYFGLPEEDWMAEGDGLPDNQLYADVRHWRGRVHFDAMWALEDELLAWPGDLGSEEAFDHFSNNEYFAMGFDNFVGSTIMALLLAGAVPCNSCAGGPGHSGRHPHVAFWAGERAVVVAEGAAQDAGVEISGSKGELPELVVWTTSDVQLLRAFAMRLAALVTEGTPESPGHSG